MVWPAASPPRLLGCCALRWKDAQAVALRLQNVAVAAEGSAVLQMTSSAPGVTRRCS